MKEDWLYHRGDVYCADLDPAVGSEQGGIRPVVVIQNDIVNKYAPTLIVVTVTSKIRKKEYMPTHFLIKDNPAFKTASVIQAEQIHTIDKKKVLSYLGKLTPKEMREVDKSVIISLALNVLKRRSPKKHTQDKERT